MDAIVLVGGEGTRLRPLTYDIPKQMLPVVDRPMIEHVVTWLARHGIGRVVLSLGYRPDAFVEAFPDGEVAGVCLAYATEPELLDTAGAVRFAAESAGVDGTFLVVNGDVLTDFDVGSLLSFHRYRNATATIHLTPVEEPSSFGVVPTDRDGRVTAFIEKPAPGTAPTNLINAGCYVLEPSVLDLIPSGRRVSIERETFPTLVGRGALYALSSDAYWIDTGTPEKYIQASLDLLHGLRTVALLPSVPQPSPLVFVDPAAVVEGVVGPATFVGRGALIAAGSEVSDSVVSEGAIVETGARVSGSVIMAGARIGPDAVIASSIVGPASEIGRSCKVTDFCVIGAHCDVQAASTLVAARFPSP
ncbi:MAG: sugar phosphate nucleotidyltransferase [Acidimicrobiales bacterium]|jgi:mannose-1-phosphate guanylyltransferase